MKLREILKSPVFPLGKKWEIRTSRSAKTSAGHGSAGATTPTRSRTVALDRGL
jgi:hypothetical protein